MTDADKAQLVDDLPPALRARLKTVKAGNATAHDHHQLGVLLSELAESAYRINNAGWWGRARILLENAAKQLYLAKSLAASNNVVQRTAIACDHALVVARMSRLETHHMTAVARVVQASREVAQVIDLLEKQRRDNSTVHHQQAIAYGFAARLAWGRALGFVASVETVTAQGYGDIATIRFANEYPDPDKGKAYRSHLLAMALAHDAMGEGRMRRKYAAKAADLADESRDVNHNRRARVIWWFGNRGERWMRRYRDGKVIPEVCAQLASL